MVNFGFGTASILGICLAIAGAALYFLRSVRPELSRDHDIFFAAVGLLCGFILLFQGWRLDPILQFGQLLLTGSTVFFAVESIRLRSVATEQAKRNTPIVDEERRPSRVYRTVAQLDDLPLEEEDEEQYSRPRIRGSRDVRSSNRLDEYEEDDNPSRSRYRLDEYDDASSRRSTSRSANRSGSDNQNQGERTRRRPSRPVSRVTAQPEADEWGASERVEDDWDVSSSRVRKSSRSGANNSSRTDRNQQTPRLKKKSRPSQSTSQQQEDESATSTEYVDYQPVNQAEEESDNTANFDDV
ncbi:MAG: Ycf66 family protein [Chroococcidiopsidaceae cyanobacterium CP_BM_ER_R8_30]|nr:Ycf66 family protein [Chroococcidiopsidaceae cyanobacterium CP_BM_ER_R8_30]